MSISVDLHPKDNEAEHYAVTSYEPYKEWPDQKAVTIRDGEGGYVVLHSLNAEHLDRLADEFHKIATSLRPPAERIADLAEKLTNGTPLEEPSLTR